MLVVALRLGATSKKTSKLFAAYRMPARRSNNVQVIVLTLGAATCQNRGKKELKRNSLNPDSLQNGSMKDEPYTHKKYTSAVKLQMFTVFSLHLYSGSSRSQDFIQLQALSLHQPKVRLLTFPNHSQCSVSSVFPKNVSTACVMLATPITWVYVPCTLLAAVRAFPYHSYLRAQRRRPSSTRVHERYITTIKFTHAGYTVDKRNHDLSAVRN